MMARTGCLRRRRIKIGGSSASSSGCDNEQDLSRYDPVSFVPRFLAEQFSQPPNLYFLFVAALQQVPDFSPTGRWGTLVTLGCLLLLSLLRTVAEDLRRRAADVRVNRRPARVMKKSDGNASFHRVRWRDVRAGDVVELISGETVPADLIVLSTSEPLGVCYADTASLDGESNLKLRQALPATSSLLSPSDLASFSATVDVPTPTRELNDFSAVLNMEEMNSNEEEGEGDEKRFRHYHVGLAQYLPRGAKLVNTDWVLGAVVAVGRDTKQLRNALAAAAAEGSRGECCCCFCFCCCGRRRGAGGRKRSTFDSEVNAVVGFMLAALVLACTGLAAGHCLHECSHQDDLSKINGTSAPAPVFSLSCSPSNLAVEFVASFARFLILLHNVVPVSLLATVQIVRIFQAREITKDFFKGSDGEQAAATVVQNSQLNEMLGQVKYVFADKTGTVTKNRLTFRKCAVVVTDPSSPSTPPAVTILDPEKDDGATAAECGRSLFLSVCLCHTVIPNQEDRSGDGGRKTKRTLIGSPDERAVLEGAELFGLVTFESRLDGGRVVLRDARRGIMLYRVTQVIEYTSERKRMTVLARPVVREGEGEGDGGGGGGGGGTGILVVTKGADSAVAPLLARGEGEAVSNRGVLPPSASSALVSFASSGLRTMCYAYRTISEAEYDRWAAGWESLVAAASGSITAAELATGKEAAAAELERDMTLVGITAVEDELQDDVVSSMRRLLSAGVNVWMISGDRQENAVSIARSSGMIPSDASPVLLLPDCELAEARSVVREHVAAFKRQRLAGRCNPVVLVVSGRTVGQCRQCGVVKKGLRRLMVWSRTVICYRVAPAQKADLVRMVKEWTGRVTLAVGDGSNDVPMIEEANVGVGVAGASGSAPSVVKAGSEAAGVADFVVAQFNALPKLILIHGACSSRRLSKTVLFFFYKSVLFYAVQLWFAFFSGFSGQVLYPRPALALYNLVFTLLPPLVLCVFDGRPRLPLWEVRSGSADMFRLTQSGAPFDAVAIAAWFTAALVHSGLVCLASVHSSPDLDLSSCGQLCYTLALVLLCLKAGLECDRLTWKSHLALWASFSAWVVFCLLQSYLPLAWPGLPPDEASYFVNPDQAGLVESQAASPSFYATFFFVVATFLLLEMGPRAAAANLRRKQEKHVDRKAGRPESIYVDSNPARGGEDYVSMELQQQTTEEEEEEDPNRRSIADENLVHLATSLPRNASRRELKLLASGFAFEELDCCEDDDDEEREDGGGHGRRREEVAAAYCRTMGRPKKRRPSQAKDERNKHKRSRSAAV